MAITKIKDYEQSDINSPRAQTRGLERMEAQENERIV
jgi:tetratricopeptide (TPR) repeat protein